MDVDFETYVKGGLLNQKYRYIRQIQKGSFGTVSLALDTANNRHVALKTMHKSREVELMARHEIEVLRKLGHANAHICQLLDSFETSDFIFLALEYCANGDLYDVIHLGLSPSAVDVYNLAKEIHSGLLYCHSLSIYHRDIKPENILFTESGSVKICDWGLATYTRQSTDFNVGLEKYMAPECFLHTPISSNPSCVVESYDCQAADYWSVGITLLTAVFGSAPFKPIESVRENYNSPDGFKQRGKSVKKSLESDSNFKNFVFYNNQSVLYDIYPDMNETCFNLFMHLLKAGGTEDDLASYHHKCQLRNFDQFITELGENWKYGLTVWEEEQLYAAEAEDSHEDSVFDMDDFKSHDTHKTEDSHKCDSLKSKDPQESMINDFKHQKPHAKDYSLPPYSGIPIGLPIQDIPIPSLAESSATDYSQPKSWCDLPDDLDDVEFSRMFNSLSFRSAPKQKEPKTNIRIVERELLASPAINWDEY